MDIFARIAERRIKDAMENGEFDNLKGMGRPITFEDETMIPEDLRMVYRILKNAGCIPPEVELRNEVVNISALINTIDDDKERLKKIMELNFKILRLNIMRNRPFNLDDFPEYELKVADKITGGL
jgi:DnaJ homologue, subfamily C, member 28, conserved domain